MTREELGKKISDPATLNTLFREGARVMTPVVIVLTGLWFITKPSAVQFVNDAIEKRQLATQAEVYNVEKRIDKLEDGAFQRYGAITTLNTKIGTIEELLREQRSDIKKLLEMRNERSR